METRQLRAEMKTGEVPKGGSFNPVNIRQAWGFRCRSGDPAEPSGENRISPVSSVMTLSSSTTNSATCHNRTEPLPSPHVPEGLFYLPSSSPLHPHGPMGFNPCLEGTILFPPPWGSVNMMQVQRVKLEQL